jgi:hypothetical protein
MLQNVCQNRGFERLLATRQHRFPCVQRTYQKVIMPGADTYAPSPSCSPRPTARRKATVNETNPPQVSRARRVGFGSGNHSLPPPSTMPPLIDYPSLALGEMIPTPGRPNPVLIQKMREILAKPGFIAGYVARNLKDLHNQGTSCDPNIYCFMFSMDPKPLWISIRSPLSRISVWPVFSVLSMP